MNSLIIVLYKYIILTHNDDLYKEYLDNYIKINEFVICEQNNVNIKNIINKYGPNSVVLKDINIGYTRYFDYYLIDEKKLSNNQQLNDIDSCIYIDLFKEEFSSLKIRMNKENHLTTDSSILSLALLEFLYKIDLFDMITLVDSSRYNNSNVGYGDINEYDIIDITNNKRTNNNNDNINKYNRYTNIDNDNNASANIANDNRYTNIDNDNRYTNINDDRYTNNNKYTNINNDRYTINNHSNNIDNNRHTINRHDIRINGGINELNELNELNNNYMSYNHNNMDTVNIKGSGYKYVSTKTDNKYVDNENAEKNGLFIFYVGMHGSATITKADNKIENINNIDYFDKYIYLSHAILDKPYRQSDNIGDDKSNKVNTFGNFVFAEKE